MGNRPLGLIIGFDGAHVKIVVDLALAIYRLSILSGRSRLLKKDIFQEKSKHNCFVFVTEQCAQVYCVTS